MYERNSWHDYLRMNSKPVHLSFYLIIIFFPVASCTVSIMDDIRTWWLLLPCDEIGFVTLSCKITVTSMADSSVDGGCAYV